MADTAARMLALLGLLQARSDWSGAELAHRLRVTDRTVRNDIDRLRGLGYPVDAVRGPGGRYRLGVGDDGRGGLGIALATATGSEERDGEELAHAGRLASTGGRSPAAGATNRFRFTAQG